MTVFNVIWQSAVGGIVTMLVGVLAAWLAHRKGWLAKPAAAVAGWLRSEGGTISTDVVELIADELQRRHLADVRQAKPAPAPAPSPAPAPPPAAWQPPAWDPKRGDPDVRPPL